MCLIASVNNGVVPSPIGFGVISRKIVNIRVSRIVVATVLTGVPWGIANGTTISATGSPTKKVYPTIVRLRNIDVVFSNNVVLIFCKSPCVGCCIVLEVSTREMDSMPFCNRIDVFCSAVGSESRVPTFVVFFLWARWKSHCCCNRQN